MHTSQHRDNSPTRTQECGRCIFVWEECVWWTRAARPARQQTSRVRSEVVSVCVDGQAEAAVEAVEAGSREKQSTRKQRVAAGALFACRRERRLARTRDMGGQGVATATAPRGARGASSSSTGALQRPRNCARSYFNRSADALLGISGSPLTLSPLRRPRSRGARRVRTGCRRGS